MRADSLFREYIWLVNTIYRAHKISFEDINRRWVSNIHLSDGVPIARTTFIRHKTAIEDIFGIFIKCDVNDGYRYFIENRSALEEDSIQNWMLSTLSVNNVLSESKVVSDRILLEPIPSDGEFLHRIIEAMKTNRRIVVDYKKYGSDHESHTVVEPYFVKLFSRRWYVIVNNPKYGNMYPLALDRIKNVEISEEEFVMPEDFSPSGYMKDQYGVVINEDAEVRRVVIRAFGQEADYMRDLPLHHTQKEIDRQENWSDFEMTLRVTMDFITPLLSRGANIRVMEPKFLAEELMYQHDDAVRLYEDEFDLLEPEE